MARYCCIYNEDVTRPLSIHTSWWISSVWRECKSSQTRMPTLYKWGWKCANRVEHDVTDTRTVYKQSQRRGLQWTATHHIACRSANTAGSQRETRCVNKALSGDTLSMQPHPEGIEAHQQCVQMASIEAHDDTEDSTFGRSTARNTYFIVVILWKRQQVTVNTCINKPIGTVMCPV